MGETDGNIEAPALPPHYAVRAYLRQQGSNVSKLLADASRMGWDCAETYRCRIATTDKLEVASNRFKEEARSAGAFIIVETYIPPAKAFPQRERSSVSGFFMEPVGLRQVNRSNGTQYTEEAVLLRTIQSVFRRKRASFGFGTGSLIITRHLLERVYERTEVHHADFTALINAEFADLLHGVALAIAAGIWIDAEDECGKFRVGAVPYSNGLVKLEARVLLAEPARDELGFRITIPSLKEDKPFVNPVGVIQGTISSAPHLLGVEMPCGVTYLNITQLPASETRYLYTFEALKAELGTDVLDRLTDAYCAPQFPQERPAPIPISDRADDLVQTTRALLNELSLHPSRSAGLCLLTPSEYVRGA